MRVDDLERRAALFAANAHANQVRKYTLAPYIVHPAAVAETVRLAAFFEPAVLAAAWLHDVVEDCSVGLRTIGDHFGPEVRHLVDWLTDPSGDGLSRADRCTRKRSRYARAPWGAQTIKVADILDNTRTVAARAPEFARLYLPEQAALLEVLTRSDWALREAAQAQVADALRSLAV